MSQGFAGNYQKNYGSTSDSRIPDVSFSGTQFSPTEMYDLPDKISTNIHSVNISCKELEHSFKNIGGSKDSVAFRNKLHEIQSKVNGIIKETSRDLRRLTDIVKRGDKKQKLHIDKLTDNFKEAIQIYSGIQKNVADKLKTTLAPSEAPVYQDDNLTSPSEEDTKALLAKQEMVNRDLEFEKGLLVEREQRIRQIEDDVLDVNQIMRELASMVINQGENINAIEESIESAHTSVEAGTRELNKAASYQDKWRRKTCILVGISVGIGLILMLIIIVTLKN